MPPLAFRTAVTRGPPVFRRQPFRAPIPLPHLHGALSQPHSQTHHHHLTYKYKYPRVPPSNCTSRSPFSTYPSNPNPNKPKQAATMAAEKTAGWEKQIKRNPHPDFKQVEASRPPYDPSTRFTYTQTPDPHWQLGSGANTPPPPDKKHIAIDPHAASRPPGANYKLLISAVVPRPIAFLSTRSADGASTNLAPFSYFQLVGHDPPLFVVGFASPLAPEAGAKDSLRNLHATGECVINIISEEFVEAANSTSVNAPYGVSEWAVSGLTPVYDCQTVGCARVKEAVFAIEGRLESVREFESRATPGKVSTTLAVIEGTRFWAREDAVNEELNMLDLKVGFFSIFSSFFFLLPFFSFSVTD